MKLQEVAIPQLTIPWIPVNFDIICLSLVEFFGFQTMKTWAFLNLINNNNNNKVNP